MSMQSATIGAEGGETPAVPLAPLGAPPAATTGLRRSRLGSALRTLLQTPSAVVGLVVVVCWVLCANFWQLVGHYDQAAPDYGGF